MVAMLSRGGICRLAASKTTSRDLARLLHQTLCARNVSPLAAARALTRAHSSVLEARRAYATTTQAATKPTATVKKAVKAKAASKTAPRKKAATAKRTTKTAAGKAKPKAKKVTRKKVAAKKPVKKKTVRVKATPEEKEKKKISELRKIALKEPVSPSALSAYSVFVGERTKGATTEGNNAAAKLSEAGKDWKTLSAADREHYNHLARERTTTRQAEYRAWILTHTPLQIKEANNARRLLRRKLESKERKSRHPAHTAKLIDDRQIKQARAPYTYFFGERQSSGDFKGITVANASKLIAEEWKALSAAEKKKYQDEAEADKARYTRELAAQSP